MLSVGFLFEVENDGMEPSKRYSFMSLLFILIKCLSKTLVMFVVAIFFVHML